MVEPRLYGYNYGTSPRKTDPIPTRRKPNQNSPKISKNKKTSTLKNTDKNKKNKQLKLKKQKAKTIFYLCVSFIVLFTICYRYSLINEEFNNLNSAKSQLSKIQRENSALKLSIENSVNLNNVEKIALEKLGMQKLDKSQMVYITLEKEDYCEVETENILEEENNIFDKLKEKIFN